MPVIHLKKDSEEINKKLSERQPEYLVYQRRVADYKKKFREIVNDIEKGGGNIESSIQFRDKSMLDLVGPPTVGEDPKERKEQLVTVLADMAARYPTLPDGERGVFSAYIPSNGTIREQKMMSDREINADPYPTPKLTWWDKFCKALHIKTQRVLLTEQIEARKQEDLQKKDKILEGMGMESQRKEFLARNEQHIRENSDLIKNGLTEEKKWNELFFGDEKPEDYKMYDGTTLSPYSVCLGRLAHKGYLNRMDPNKPWTTEEIKACCGEKVINEAKQWYKERLDENLAIRNQEKTRGSQMSMFGSGSRAFSRVRFARDTAMAKGLMPDTKLKGVTVCALDPKKVPQAVGHEMMTKEQHAKSWPLAKFKYEMSSLELSKGNIYRQNVAGDKEAFGRMTRANRECRLYEAIYNRQYEDARNLSESTFRHAVKVNGGMAMEQLSLNYGGKLSEKFVQKLDQVIDHHLNEREQIKPADRSYKEVFRMADMVLNHEERKELEIVPNKEFKGIYVTGEARSMEVREMERQMAEKQISEKKAAESNPYEQEHVHSEDLDSSVDSNAQAWEEYEALGME